MPSAPIIRRIDRALHRLGERQDVATAIAARETFRSVLASLRELQKKAKVIAKKTAPDNRRSDASFLMGSYANYAEINGIPTWIMGERNQITTGGFEQTVPDGQAARRLGVWFERPSPNNKRYGGVYIEWVSTSGTNAGGDVHVVLQGTYTVEEFTDPLWFALHAADIFDHHDQIFVHELTHHWDTMCAKDVKSYNRSTAKGRTAFWATPENEPAPAEYLLSNNELNARFMEFTSACIRQIDVSAAQAQLDFRTIDDAAKGAGKTFSQYTGGSSARDFVESLVFSTIFGSSAHSFVNRVGHVVSNTDFPRVYAMMDKPTQTKYIKRLAALYADLAKHADVLVTRILNRKAIKLSVKKAKLPSGGKAFVHR